MGSHARGVSCWPAGMTTPHHVAVTLAYELRLIARLPRLFWVDAAAARPTAVATTHGATAVTNVLAAAEWGGEFDGVLDPSTRCSTSRRSSLFEFSLFGVDLSINRTILIAWLMTLCALLFVGRSATRRSCPASSSPRRDGRRLRAQIALDIIGPKGLKFVPLLTTIFVFIFFMNVAKITPFLMLPPTSRIAWPLFLALIAWLVYVGVGIKEQGFVGYFKELAFPPGCPRPLYVILTPIEIVSNLILRPFTLAVRLFANMVAGHILVVITLVTIHVFLPSAGRDWPIGILALIASPAGVRLRAVHHRAAGLHLHHAHRRLHQLVDGGALTLTTCTNDRTTPRRQPPTTPASPGGTPWKAPQRHRLRPGDARPGIGLGMLIGKAHRVDGPPARSGRHGPDHDVHRYRRRRGARAARASSSPSRI
jgi:F-type H+-transporting ATPase subunit a